MTKDKIMEVKEDDILFYMYTNKYFFLYWLLFQGEDEISFSYDTSYKLHSSFYCVYSKWTKMGKLEAFICYSWVSVSKKKKAWNRNPGGDKQTLLNNTTSLAPRSHMQTLKTRRHSLWIEPGKTSSKVPKGSDIQERQPIRKQKQKHRIVFCAIQPCKKDFKQNGNTCPIRAEYVNSASGSQDTGETLRRCICMCEFVTDFALHFGYNHKNMQQGSCWPAWWFSAMDGLTAMKFDSDLHGFQGMKPIDFHDSLTFPSSATSGQKRCPILWFMTKFLQNLYDGDHG